MNLREPRAFSALTTLTACIPRNKIDGPTKHVTLASLKSGPRDALACPKQAEAGGMSLGIAAVSHTTVRAVGARLGPPLII